METGATSSVNIFPWLKYFPEKLFENYVTRVKDIGRQMKSLYSDILDQVIKRRESGIQLNSFMDRVLEQQKKNELSPNQLRYIGDVLMKEGFDTSSSLILVIVQAMIKYPDVQANAHAEIDAVIGSDRSSKWPDFEKLSYINMIVKEDHRWRPILSLDFSHALAEGEFSPSSSSTFSQISSPLLNFSRLFSKNQKVRSTHN